MPEFLRPKDAARLFGVGKSTLANWVAKGIVKSYLVRQQGNVSGLRLIATKSLRELIESYSSTPASQKAFRNRSR